MADVWIDGVWVGCALEVKYAKINRENLEKICPLWPPESLSELERANHWRPVAKNEAKALEGG